MKYNGLDVFEGFVTEEGTGMMAISLVLSPANESDFLYFSNDQEPLMFSVQDPDKHIVRGLLMGAGQMIYRRNGDYEYYITYSADTLRLMAERYLLNGFSSNVDLNHDGKPVSGVNMTQIFIKDTEAGINPKGFEDYKDGSLFVEFKVNNDEVWEQIKDGDFKGFSLAGVFEVRETLSKQTNNTTMKIQKIKQMLKQMLTETFASVSTDKGLIAWDSEEELPQEGERVYSLDEEGNEIEVEDGEYATETKIIVISEGRVSEIRDREQEQPEAEPEETPEETPEQEPEQPEEQPAEEPEAEPEAEPEREPEREPEAEPEVEPEIDERDARIAELEATIAERDARIAELEARIKELEDEPAAKPAEEEYKSVNRVPETGNVKLDRLARILNAQR